jgi:GNAT superfamily N-acetyltransferase
MLIRQATPDDAAVIRQLIVELATYEREPDAVVVTEAELRDQLSWPAPPFECLIAECEGEAAGFALFFHNYSTWRGRQGLYLEDLFVLERHRRHGVGGALLAELARLAVERRCARMEWAVLDWNRPAVDFYRSLGAEPLSDWTVFRLTNRALDALAARAQRRR